MNFGRDWIGKKQTHLIKPERAPTKKLEPGKDWFGLLEKKLKTKNWPTLEKKIEKGSWLIFTAADLIEMHGRLEEKDKCSFQLEGGILIECFETA